MGDVAVDTFAKYRKQPPGAVAALVLLGLLGVAVSSVGAPDAELTPAQRKDLEQRANEANQLRGW